MSFTDQSQGNPTSWTWYFGDGQTGSGQHPKHIYTRPGTYSVTLRAINAEGVTFEAKQGFITVTEKGTPTPPVVTPPGAAFSADKVSGSAPLTVSFTDESTGNPGSYAWTFGDGTSATEANPTHAYTKPGRYTVTLKVTNAGGTNTVTKSSYISVVTAPAPSKPTAPVPEFTADTVRGPAPLQVSFTDQSQGNPTSWTWYFGNGQTPYERNPTHIYTEPGAYTVILRVFNKDGIHYETKTGYIKVL